MPSPFPGMNPYLEQNDSWQDFHQSFMAYTRASLAAQVGGSYLVKIEVSLYLHELGEEERRFFARADAGVASTVNPAALTSGSVVALAPVQLPFSAVDIERHSSIEIRDRRNRRLVTAIELLSPTNKTPGPDRDAYLSKRTQLIASKVNFVEIDLRRGGERPQPPELPECDYYAFVTEAGQKEKMGVWPINLRERLPVIPIPLAPPDAPVKLDLQAILNRVYDEADYGKYIYAETPEPELVKEDLKWAQQYLPRGTNGKIL